MTGIKKETQNTRRKSFEMSLVLLSALALSACENDKIGMGELFQDPTVLDKDEDGFSIADGDCDDSNAAINPNATEICDGIDNDCNTKTDDGMLSWKWENSKAQLQVGEGVASLTIEQDSRGWDGMDMMADGLIDQKRTLYFDGKGHVLTEELDHNMDGEIDLRTEYIYTGAGLIKEIKVNQHADESIESIETFNYQGKTLLDKRTDIDADGEIDVIESWNRNANGQLISRTIDNGANGEIDSGTWFHYDDSGLLVSEVNRVEGEQTGSKLYAYSDTGSLIYIDVDSENDSDNAVDLRRYESEDVEHQLKIIEIDRNIDGEIDEIHTEYFDAEGRLRKREKDYDLDQNIDHNFSLTYGDDGLVVMDSQDLLNGNEEGFEVSHIRGNMWESIRTINTDMFEAMIEEKLQFECESPSFSED